MKIVHSILGFNNDDDLVHEVVIPDSEVSIVREFLGVPPWDKAPGDHDIDSEKAKILCRAYGSPFEVDEISWFFGAFRQHDGIPKI